MQQDKMIIYQKSDDALKESGRAKIARHVAAKREVSYNVWSLGDIKFPVGRDTPYAPARSLARSSTGLSLLLPGLLLGCLLCERMNGCFPLLLKRFLKLLPS